MMLSGFPPPPTVDESVSGVRWRCGGRAMHPVTSAAGPSEQYTAVTHPEQESCDDTQPWSAQVSSESLSKWVKKAKIQIKKISWERKWLHIFSRATIWLSNSLSAGVLLLRPLPQWSTALWSVDTAVTLRGVLLAASTVYEFRNTWLNLISSCRRHLEQQDWHMVVKSIHFRFTV